MYILLGVFFNVVRASFLDLDLILADLKDWWYPRVIIRVPTVKI